MKTRKSAAPRKIKSETWRSGMEKASVSPVYPFSAIVGQEEMKLALLLNVIDPLIGGVLIMGQRGTGKSTAVRGLAELLPEIRVVRNCIYRCDPAELQHLCHDCQAKQASGIKLHSERVAVRVVNLPLGATEDRVCGTIDIQRALQSGIKAFEPGLLAGANRGFLYIDEVNLLDDHLVDVLLDAAATGRNRVEREGISIEHPARFVLIGSGNPEEGELRPQLQDRFGLHVEVTTDNRRESRVAVVEKRDAFDHDPDTFLLAAEAEQVRLRRQITKARSTFVNLRVDQTLLRLIASLCSELKVDGHRGELTITRAARALAALEGRRQVTPEDVRRVAIMSLRHRLRRDVLEETASADQIREAMERVFAASSIPSSRTDDGGAWPGDRTGKKDQSTSSDLDSSVGKARSRGSADAAGANGGDNGLFRLPLPADLDSRIQKLETSGPRASRVHQDSVGQANGRHKTQTSGIANEKRGRYRRAVSYRTSRLAVETTLRASAIEIGRAIDGTSRISSHSLRYKLFAQKGGTLFIFAIDTSGSMALNRINQAKGALLRLLKTSYINRDQVAVVAFGGASAKVLLAPSRSILRARRVLDSLSVGGGTPLSAGLLCSLAVARRASSQGKSDIRLLVFTDGRANVLLRKNGAEGQTNVRALIQKELESLGSELRRAGILTTVVETEHRFAPIGEADWLAEILEAQLVQIRRDAEGETRKGRCGEGETK
jgi:magnesium chelatase ATPase subunit I